MRARIGLACCVVGLAVGAGGCDAKNSEDAGDDLSAATEDGAVPTTGMGEATTQPDDGATGGAQTTTTTGAEPSCEALTDETACDAAGSEECWWSEEHTLTLDDDACNFAPAPGRCVDATNLNGTECGESELSGCGESGPYAFAESDGAGGFTVARVGFLCGGRPELTPLDCQPPFLDAETEALCGCVCGEDYPSR